MTTRFAQLRLVVPLIALFIGIILIGMASRARAESFRIDGVARPSRVTYGADNNVTITVTVRDGTGGTAPDGTAVYFHTTLGILPALAYTKQGQVSVLLENTSGPGQAIVTFTVGSSQQSITVEYLGKGGVAVSQAKRLSYHLKARQVYYSVDKKIFDLRENAIFTTPTFTVKADAIQFDIEHEQLNAQTNVTITAGKETLTGDKLNLYLNAKSGFLVAITPELSFVSLSIPSLKTKDDEAAKTTDYTPITLDPTRTWIICNSATVFPHEQIQFRWPKFYLNNFNHLLLVLPNHVIDLRSAAPTTFFNSQISLASDAGLNVDFPIYYAANSSHLGSLHIREVSKGSSYYRGSEGMQFGLEEEYLVGAKGDGALYLDDLSRESRSATWEHTQDFGKTRISLNGAYERYTSDTPYTSRLGMSVSQDLGKTNLYLTSNWSEFQGDQDGVAELTAYLPPIRFGKSRLSLSFNPFVGTNRAVTAATADQPKSTENLYYQGIRSSVSIPSWQFLGGTLSPTLSDEVSHNSHGLITNYLDSGLSLRKQLNSMFSTALSYSFSLSQTSEDPVAPKPSQRLSLDFSGSKPQVWDLMTYSSYSFADHTFYGTANTTYYIPFGHLHDGHRRWYLQYTASLSAGDTDTADHLFSLGWDVGAYSLVVHYSPTGNNAVTGIGSGTGKHWSVELVRQGW